MKCFVIIEPERDNRRQLERTLLLHGVMNCHIVPQAAWSPSGSVGWHQDNQPVSTSLEESRDDHAVDGVSIDDLIRRLSLARVERIKMGIASPEVDALEAAEATLRRFHRQLIIEHHETLNRITEFFAQVGHSIVVATFDARPKRNGWNPARVPLGSMVSGECRVKTRRSHSRFLSEDSSLAFKRT